MRWKRLPAVLIGAVTTAALTAVAPAAAAPAPRPDRAVAEPVSVTLITGDRVTTGAGGAQSVQPGPGRAGMRFVSRVAALAANEALGIEGLHVFTFNQVEVIEAWRRRMLDQAVEARSRPR